MPERTVAISTDAIKLDAFLKWAGAVATGGEAKGRIQRGEVRVNGVLERRRGRTLQPGDQVQLSGQPTLIVGGGTASRPQTRGAIADN